MKMHAEMEPLGRTVSAEVRNECANVRVLPETDSSDGQCVVHDEEVPRLLD